MPTPIALRQFAFEILLPLCRDRFADPVHGGFHERLDSQHQPMALNKRLLVQCRQLYVLSHAALAGDRSGAAVAEAGYAFLRRAYLDERHGGWFFSVTPDGQPADQTKDFYGHAFALYALAYLHRAFASPDALALAHETMDLLKARLAAPNGGFWEKATAEWQPDRTAIRRQNPHMHLLEALLALFEASGERRWIDEARAIVRLFLDHFYEPATGTLGEFFDADWAPHPEQGHIVEAGHHFEWFWLLDRYRTMSGDATAAGPAQRLFDEAMAHGFDPLHGGIHDQIDRQGVPVLRSRRIWPVTEAIKASIVHLHAGNPNELARAEALIRLLFKDFLRHDERLWIEVLAADGTPAQTDMPGSTPYHLFVAAIEAQRLLTPGGTT
ncbi:MAG TPA: AGE family epimerase/isomerase [Stellaceae bacterium]|nr:AGE family epimerase/isomerase [Stellaceae bacterium]